MMNRTLAVLALALGLSLPAAAAPADDVNAALKSLGDAFTKGDAKAAVALGTDGLDIINPAGVRGKGKAEAEKVIAGDLATILKGTTSKFTSESAKEVGAGVWLVDATQEVTNMKMPDGKTGTGKFHVVFVAVKGKDGKIAFSAARPYQYLTPPPAGSAPAAKK